MNDITYAFLPAVMLLMFGGLIATWLHLAGKPDGRIERIATQLGWIVLAVYFVWMGLVTVQQQQVPVATIGQLAVFLGFLVWAGQSYVQSRIRQRLLVVLPIGAVIVLILIGTLAGVQANTMPDALKGGGAAVHITLSLAGVAMLLGGGVYGAGTLILHRQIAHKAFGPFFSLLPPMGDMNRLRTTAIYVGWLLLTVSLVSAYVWILLFKTDSKVVISHLHPMLTLWVIVTGLAASAKFNWLGQHKLAALSVALAAVVMALVLVSVIEIFAGKWL